jgi:hypothetical protein
VTRTVEVGLAGPRVTRDYVEDLVVVPFDGVLDGIVKESGDVRDLLGREWKPGHTLVGTAPKNDRADRIAVLVIQDQHGAKQIGSFFPAFCV